MVEYLRALYNLFKDVPAHRGTYTEFSGSKIFPKKFCSIRWLENSDIAQRAIEILPDVILYVNSVKGDKKRRPSSSSFKIVAENITDPLLTAELEFLISLTSEVEPFLREYQTDDPMIPFLHTDITTVMKSVMSRFVRPDILSATPIMRIDLNDAKNILPVNKIDLGYGTRRALRNKNLVEKIPDSSILKFCRDCFASLKILASKLLEKSPAAYPMVKALTCFDPSIAANDNCRKLRIRKLLTTLEEHRHISSLLADQAEKQFHLICSESALQEELKAFSCHTQRVDQFWSHLFKRYTNTDAIQSVMEMVMIFFHGNSNVERGFSVNKECVVDNMKEETLIAQRLVYDGVMDHGKDIGNMDISKSLIHSYKNARSRLTEETKKREREDLENKVHKSKKRKLYLEKKELEFKIAKIKENATKEVEALTEEINSLNNTKL
ncbi:hypothetical protein AVEN_99516-1 [Araneus ventricosus]|uniref:HAT C-terminal dimerisation domain-containing protein n=1 Tax=Araneus ventricosus TaxID=182803 RepID=A0A4Y2AXH9_ARAVE|nr:hypothetical protein AVEN_99516-1 [Araneus ventricosus]